MWNAIPKIGQSGYIDPAFPYCVLPSPGRDYSAYKSSRPSPRQIRPIHNDPGHF